MDRFSRHDTNFWKWFTVFLAHSLGCRTGVDFACFALAKRLTGNPSAAQYVSWDDSQSGSLQQLSINDWTL